MAEWLPIRPIVAALLRRSVPSLAKVLTIVLGHQIQAVQVASLKGHLREFLMEQITQDPTIVLKLLQVSTSYAT